MAKQDNTNEFQSKQALIALADRVSSILSMDIPINEAAQKLVSDYGDDALELAEICSQSFPGKRNSNKQAYWQNIADLIRKARGTTH